MAEHSLESALESRQSICFISRKWFPAVGGMETYSVRLSEALKMFGKVKVYCLPGRKDGSTPTAASIVWFGISTAFRLLLARRSPNVVHVADMASWPLAFIASLRTRRVALSAHGTDVSLAHRGGLLGPLYNAYLYLARGLLPRASIVANSRATADAVRAIGFSRIAVVPLGTDIRPLAEPTGEHNGQVLFVGRLTPRKGCAWFIREVLPCLPESVTLRVAGTAWDTNETAALNNSRVTFLGAVHGEALIREYSSALCVIVPNIDNRDGEFEGFGLIAVEAAAAGGVVLAASHSGLKDAVVDGQTGFQLKSGDVSEWVAKISEIYDWTIEKRAAFVSTAIETTRRVYSWDRVVRETHEAYSLEG